MRIRVVLAPLASLLLTSCFPSFIYVDGPTLVRAASRELVVDGPFRHEHSGMLFPLVLAGSTRNIITAYSASADDVSVGYDTMNPLKRVSTTIYVYPRRNRPPADLAGQFRAVIAEISHYHAGAEASPTQEKFVKSKGVAGRGLMTRFTYRSRTHFRNENVESLAYLFACGDWFVKYRFTYPRAQKDRVIGVVDALLEKLEWPTDKQAKGGR